MLPKWIKHTLKYYSFYNFYLAPSTTILGKSFKYFVLLIHVILSAWCTFNAFDMFAEVQSIMAHLDTLNLFGYYLSGSLTYWLIIFDSYSMQKTQNEFWRSYVQINKQLRPQRNDRKRIYLITLIMLPVMDILFFAFAITHERTTQPADKIMHVFFLDLFAHRACFYLLFIKVIELQLQNISTELENMLKLAKFVDEQPNNACQKFNQFMENRFKWIMNYYKTIYEMSQNVNEIFGFSHLSLILLNCFCIFAFINFMYRRIMRKLNEFDYGSNQFFFFRLSSAILKCVPLIFRNFDCHKYFHNLSRWIQSFQFE